jgi:hypothetical protein
MRRPDEERELGELGEKDRRNKDGGRKISRRRAISHVWDLSERGV